jgi:hypothetical protein
MRAKRTLLHIVALLLAALAIPSLIATSARAQAQAQAVAPPGGVAGEKLACGCHVRVKNLACSPSSAQPVVHFFTGLEVKDPLHLTLDGQAIELPHKTHRGNSVKGDKRGRWIDEYASERIQARISYAPGTSSCAKTKGESCEYTDYKAEVRVQQAGRAPQTFQAIAMCGC